MIPALVRNEKSHGKMGKANVVQERAMYAIFYTRDQTAMGNVLAKFGVGRLCIARENDSLLTRIYPAKCAYAVGPYSSIGPVGR